MIENETEILEGVLDVLKDIRVEMRKLSSFLLDNKVTEYIETSDIRKDVFSLCDGKNSVSDIVRKTGKLQPNVSAIISDLLAKGIIKEGRRDGRTTYYVSTI